MGIKKNIITLFCLCLLALTACNKEDLDEMIVNEDENLVTVVDCEGFSVELYEAGGVIEVEVFEGTAPYTYFWSTEETTAAIEVESPGTYGLTVTDAEGCETSAEITVEDIGEPCDDFTVSISHNGSGDITANASGGTPPYTYFWSTEETTAAIEVEGPGTYGLTVTDAEGCETSAEITVEDIGEPCDDFTVSISHNGSGDITANASGGTPPYDYAWSNGATTSSLSVEEGTYSVTVTDAADCQKVDEIVVVFNSGNCNGILNLDAPDTNAPIVFSANSEGYLFKSGCSSVSDEIYDHNYLVVDVNWDYWGTGMDPEFFHISDGLPGISFGSNGLPQQGDVLSPYFIGEDLFRDTVAQVSYNFDNIQITITEAANAVGGQIGGTISGTIVDVDDSSNTSSISGDFCVTLVTVCD